MSRPTVAELALRYPALDDVETDPRRDMAAEVYSLWTQFGRREFGWRDWSPGRAGVDGHREWRLMLGRLRYYGVPHEVAEDYDGNRVALTQASWRWQALEGGLVCAVCAGLFRPKRSQLGSAWAHNPVRCEVCS